MPTRNDVIELTDENLELLAAPEFTPRQMAWFRMHFPVPEFQAGRSIEEWENLCGEQRVVEFVEAAYKVREAEKAEKLQGRSQ